jgi:hypothetical protein
MRSAVAAFSIVSLSVLGALAIGQQPSVQKADDLLARITALESRVAALEQRHPVAMIPSPHAPRQIPEGWTPHSFNGTTYYIVPLEGSDKSKR